METAGPSGAHLDERRLGIVAQLLHLRQLLARLLRERAVGVDVAADDRGVLDGATHALAIERGGLGSDARLESLRAGGVNIGGMVNCGEWW